jgi:hypothetical protein
VPEATAGGTSPAPERRRGHSKHMDREQLIQRLRARVQRGGCAEQVWWNGELLHVSEAIVRAAELDERELIRARGDDVVIPSLLRDDS